MNSSNQDSYESGKQEATNFYQAEIQKLREEIAESAKKLLSEINQKVRWLFNEN